MNLVVKQMLPLSPTVFDGLIGSSWILYAATDELYTSLVSTSPLAVVKLKFKNVGWKRECCDNLISPLMPPD